MKKLKLKRLTLDELAEVMLIVKKEEQQTCMGGADPYSWNSGNNQDSTNCVAYALADLGGVDLNDAISFLNNRYGSNGVPSSAIDSVIRHFYPSATQVSRSSLGTGAMSNTFIWYPTSDSTGHAVNGFWNTSGGDIITRDPQNGGNTGTIFSTDSCYIYQVR